MTPKRTVIGTVSIIVLNWNGKQYLETCLSSLVRQTYKNIEIIFVDNGSSDGSIDFVRNEFPGVVILGHAANLGFAEGVNSGIRISGGEFIATINNDAQADDNWIKSLVEVMESDPGIGCCGSKMLRYYARNIIDSAGIVIYQNGNAYDRGREEKDTGQYDIMEEIFGPCAGAALYRREMLDEIGLFDKEYFAYFEDVDISFRMHLSGWKCIFVPDAIVYHMHSATAKSSSPFKIFFIERNKLWNMWKYFPVKMLLIQLPFTNIYYFRYLILFIKAFFGKTPEKEEPVLNYSFRSILFAVFRAKLSAYAKLPHILNQRMKLRSNGADFSRLDRWIIKSHERI
ncbi:N-acetylglucosaminyl-diphospho-decaprenol L-rhamnosyltransferase [Methanosarcinales archaeon]|uniref:glycosyltransferase family 2 protein n=1 Tax=Candidatus Methanoperedens sp. BLZ2 TaxID=2035255 RepID=UPI000BE38EFC|nr:glycosyltransferase family 2 protein [Candidatus Methanoperedens sp. BLZ2]KAB2942463.1 MAG: glycosyltransferase family 2 protein [Candidatus Methanoperedens sp.]MBZ0177149.1 glycosyltransferase family 2 protein [Candidatus Methanoperedens nitroreducens]CAG0971146.1 N-acetylglucosaminyl-diphospho-decaprenol L-rhamnosyltransferase [Methanosarcinales archaeon]MCX9077580.1 glycosyltransferase family 2 protein [Candidatus Methanoperedens sp.]MCX9087309.1 glycosyltransferase family 2 protein [Can